MASFVYDYLEAGFRIFPLWKIVNGGCSCGQDDCKMPGKHPRISNWTNVPHWSDEQIEVMESTGQLDTGFGVVVDDHLVIDIDPRNGGDESYKRLCKDTGIDYEAESGFVVSTGGGGLHIYFKNIPPASLMAHHNEYKGIDFKSGSTYMVGCGSLHKSGNYYEKKKGNPCDLTPIPPALLELLKKPDHYRAVFNGESLDVTEQEICDMLAHVNADVDYDDWIKIGMAVHHSTNGDGFHLWNVWSSKGKKYNGGDELDKHWHSFGKSANPVTIGTLFHMAEAGGYKRSITFTMPQEEHEEQRKEDDHPFSIDTIDLLRPPGFVGKVTNWINSQCLFPREHMAAAAAIHTVGNIAGLRYIDDISGVTANLFTFCAAGSGSGKEKVLEAMMELHIAAGVSPAVHGAIKSEQEIIRNLLRHQMAAYITDELGYLLKKIANAGKSGASYLEGVVAMFMSAYGKADGYMPISGDLKEDIRVKLMKDIATCEEKISNNEDKDGFFEQRKPRAEYSLKELDKGIVKPFLSAFGVTTPETFDSLINFEQATNGFVGRAWIVREHETNPRKKKKFKKAPPDSYMNATLKQLYNQGTCNPDMQVCVEHRGDKIEVRTDKEAEDMLEQVSDWIEDYAEKHKGATGLESIVKRGYELCAKISLILAIPSGLRTAEHVRWAYAAMRKDIDAKIMLARSNILASSERSDSLVEVLRTRIISACGYEDGEPISVICQRAMNKKYTKQDVQAMVVAMVDDGSLESYEVEHGKTHVKSLRYVAV